MMFDRGSQQAAVMHWTVRPRSSMLRSKDSSTVPATKLAFGPSGLKAAPGGDYRQTSSFPRLCGRIIVASKVHLILTAHKSCGSITRGSLPVQYLSLVVQLWIYRYIRVEQRWLGDLVITTQQEGLSGPTQHDLQAIRDAKCLR